MTRREAVAGGLTACATAALGVGRADYRVAIIGHTGRGDYGHGLDTVWLDVPGTRVVAVADGNQAGGAAASARLGGCKRYDDYRAMLAAEKPDLVSIATRWTDQHLDMALACAAAKVRGALIEKPLCRDLAEADRIIAACERSGMKMAITHQTRYVARMMALRDMLRSGRFGDLVEMRARGKEDARGGGEDMIVLGTHLMDFMRYLAGDARWCFADVTEGGKPIGPKSVRRASEDIGPVAGDAVSVVFGFAPPTMGFFASHRAKHGAPSRYGIELRCTKAVIVVRPSPPDIRFCEDPEWNPGKTGAAWHTLSSAGIDAPEPLPDNTHHLANTLIARDLIGAVEQGREPEGSARDGRAALEMILAAYESRRQGKAVALPIENRRHPLDMIAGGVKAWP